ncbi:MAG: carbohydrate kinase [Balneolaceae bacterium]|nr:carbohydrate kinase [Balneolaceae bacterium]
MSKVVCIGEVLWDSLPHGMFLGGAPLNVAVNLRNLDVDTSIISAVGDDELGEKTRSEIKKRGVETTHIQTNRYKTGLVEVELTEKGIPSYVIHEHRAWDYIEATEDAKSVVNEADYVVFGSLGFRNADSAQSIKKLLVATDATKILDVNFRKPFYTKPLIEELLGLADVLKVNDEEIEEMADWFGLDADYKSAIPKLCAMYGIEKAIITLGEEGSSLYVDGEFAHHPRFDVKVKDTVGAGDAFLSGVIFSMIQNKSPEETLQFANAMGAFVAGSEGATPVLNLSKIEGFINK